MISPELSRLVSTYRQATTELRRLDDSTSEMVANERTSAAVAECRATLGEVTLRLLAHGHRELVAALDDERLQHDRYHLLCRQETSSSPALNVALAHWCHAQAVVVARLRATSPRKEP